MSVQEKGTTNGTITDMNEMCIRDREYTLVTVADYVLKHTPGNTVSNLSSTRALRDVTRKYGMEYLSLIHI